MKEEQGEKGRGEEVNQDKDKKEEELKKEEAVVKRKPWGRESK